MVRTANAPSKDKIARATVISAVQRAIVTVLSQRTICSADDVRPIVEIPPDINPSIVGIAFRLLAKARVITVASIGVTNRKVAHGRLARFWKLAEPKTGQHTPEGGH